MRQSYLISVPEEKTAQIQSLIKRSKSSALDAWDAGKVLSSVCFDNFKGDQDGFKEYVYENFQISFDTAHKYMELSNKFERDAIESNMFVTHLYPLLDIKDELRLEFFEIIKKTKARFTRKDVQETINIIEGFENRSLFCVETVFKDTIEKNREKRKRRISPDGRGDKIQSDYFQEVTELFPYKPIDEQGLVGLFCMMFPHLREKVFRFGSFLLQFERIEFLRTQFPDSLLIAKNTNKPNGVKLLHSEFEYESGNYLRHKHHEAKNRKCDLIICWKNDLDEGLVYENVPPVLSVENVLRYGEIELIDLGG